MFWDTSIQLRRTIYKHGFNLLMLLFHTPIRTPIRTPDIWQTVLYAIWSSICPEDCIASNRLPRGKKPAVVVEWYFEGFWTYPNRLSCLWPWDENKFYSFTATATNRTCAANLDQSCKLDRSSRHGLLDISWQVFWDRSGCLLDRLEIYLHFHVASGLDWVHPPCHFILGWIKFLFHLLGQ